MLDFTKLFSKLANKDEGYGHDVEWAVYTLKTEFGTDPMISQQAADALDILYKLAAGAVPKEDLQAAAFEMAANMDAYEATGCFEYCHAYREAIGVLKKHFSSLEVGKWIMNE